MMDLRWLRKVNRHRRRGAHNYSRHGHRVRTVVRRIVYRDLRGPHVHVMKWNACFAVVEFDSRGRWTTTRWRNTREDARRLADAVSRRIRRTGEPVLGTFPGGDR